MPQETIGFCGNWQSMQTSKEDKQWCSSQLEFGIAYLKAILGDPPKGFEMEIVYREHDFGDLPSIGITWSHPKYDADIPWHYINRCRLALEIFNSAVDWNRIDPVMLKDEKPEIFEREAEDD
jgi:hypothetical protein